jgi:hypothetical protein
LNHEDINHLNSCIISNEIEPAIKSLAEKKSPGPDRFTAEFYQNIKEELIPIFLSLFHEIERERTLTQSFSEVSITLIPKSDKDITKSKRNIGQFL